MGLFSERSKPSMPDGQSLVKPVCHQPRPSLRPRPDAIINEPEKIPLGSGLGLEVPEDPALDLTLEDIELGTDIVGVRALLILVPLIDKVHIPTRADIL